MSSFPFPQKLGQFPTTRMRRNRQTDWSRRLIGENTLTVNDLIWPIFVQEGENGRRNRLGTPEYVGS